MAEPTHLIITDEGEAGVIAESPQVPGFVMGRTTVTEFLADYQQVLSDVGVRGRIVRHRQVPVVLSSGEEVLLRCRRGDDEAERLLLAGRIADMLHTDEGSRFLDDAPRSPTGEIVVICTSLTDLVEDLIQQLNPREDVAVIAAPASDVAVWTTAIGRGDRTDFPAWVTFEDLGLDTSITVAELMVALNESTPHPESLLIAV